MVWTVSGKVGAAAIYPPDNESYSLTECTSDFAFIGGGPPPSEIREMLSSAGIYRMRKLLEILEDLGEKGRRFTSNRSEKVTGIVWFFDDQARTEKSCNFFVGIEDDAWAMVASMLRQAMTDGSIITLSASGNFSVENNINEGRSPTATEFCTGFAAPLFDPKLSIVRSPRASEEVT